MRNIAATLRFRTLASGLMEITGEVQSWLESQSVSTGLLTLFCRHTSASLLIQENAARAVRRDLENYFAALAPEDPRRYEHNDEGPDDMPAHLRTALTGVQVSIPVNGGRLALGTWQGIYLFEHRRRPHEREIALHLIGDCAAFVLHLTQRPARGGSVVAENPRQRGDEQANCETQPYSPVRSQVSPRTDRWTIHDRTCTAE